MQLPLRRRAKELVIFLIGEDYPMWVQKERLAVYLKKKYTVDFVNKT